MKRTDTVTKITILLLFLALASYLGLYVWRAFSVSYKTVSAVSVPVWQTGEFSGVILREDTVLVSGEPYFAVSAAEGERVALGQPLGLTWAGADRPRLREELEDLREALALARDFGPGPEDAARALSLALGRGDSKQAARLSALLPRGFQDKKTLEARLRTLLETGGTSLFEAPFSGLFSSAADGLEALSPDLLTSGLTPGAVREMENFTPTVPPGCIGRLTAGVYWYIAAVLPEAEADKLTLQGEAELALPGLGPLTAQVYLLGPAQEGERAAVFRLDRALAEALDRRFVSAQIVFARLSGLRLPEKAVHEDESGFFVYTAASGLALRRGVEVYDRQGGYVTAVSPDGALSEGDPILVGDKVYDAMPLN